MSFQPGDKVFAKVFGFPHWPARINPLPAEVAVPRNKFAIFFYGTHEVYFLPAKDIFPYEKYRERFAKPRRLAHFNDGLREIEEQPRILYYGEDPDALSFLSRFYPVASRHADDQSYLQLPQSSTTSVNKASPLAVSIKRKRARSTATHHHRLPSTPSSVLDQSKDELQQTQTEEEPLLLNALGRPVRQSAKNFDVKRMLSIEKESGLFSKEDTDEDSDFVVEEKQQQQPCNNEAVLRTNAKRLSSFPMNSDSGEETDQANDATALLESPNMQLEQELSQLVRRSAINGSLSLTHTCKQMKHRHRSHVSAPHKKVKLDDASAAAACLVKQESASTQSTLPSRHSTSLLMANRSFKKVAQDSSSVDSPMKFTLRAIAPSAQNTHGNKAKEKSCLSAPQATCSLVSPRNLFEKNLGQDLSSVASLTSTTQNLAQRESFSQVSQGTQQTLMSAVLDKPCTSARALSTATNDCENKVADLLPTANSLLDNNPTSSVPFHEVYQNRLQLLKEAKKRQKMEEKRKAKLANYETEAKLRMMNSDVRGSLVRGQENHSACIYVMNQLLNMDLQLIMLAKFPDILVTIRKCRKYRGSELIRQISCQVLDKFNQLFRNADKQELFRAEVEYLKVRDAIQTCGSSSRATSAVVQPARSICDLFAISSASFGGPPSSAGGSALSAAGIVPPKMSGDSNSSNQYSCNVFNKKAIDQQCVDGDDADDDEDDNDDDNDDHDGQRATSIILDVDSTSLLSSGTTHSVIAEPPPLPPSPTLSPPPPPPEDIDTHVLDMDVVHDEVEVVDSYVGDEDDDREVAVWQNSFECEDGRRDLESRLRAILGEEPAVSLRAQKASHFPTRHVPSPRDEPFNMSPRIVTDEPHISSCSVINDHHCYGINTVVTRRQHHSSDESTSCHTTPLSSDAIDKYEESSVGFCDASHAALPSSSSCMAEVSTDDEEEEGELSDFEHACDTADLETLQRQRERLTAEMRDLYGEESFDFDLETAPATDHAKFKFV